MRPVSDSPVTRPAPPPTETRAALAVLESALGNEGYLNDPSDYPDIAAAWECVVAALSCVEALAAAAQLLYEAANEEVAEKENTPEHQRGGADFWAAQAETEYTGAIPGIGRRIRLARAVVAARESLAPFSVAAAERTTE